MDRPCDEFLPGARLSDDQDVRVGGSHNLDVPQDSPESGAVPNHLFEILLALDIFGLDALTPVAVTKANINDTVIKDGFLTKDQICTGKYAKFCSSAGL